VGFWGHLCPSIRRAPASDGLLQAERQVIGGYRELRKMGSRGYHPSAVAAARYGKGKNLRSALVILLFIVSLFAESGEITPCNGTVLQRRVALVQLGQLADTYILANGALPNICAVPVAGVSDSIPGWLQDASVCGSSEEGAVYYSCQIPSKASPVIERCRYSLADQSMTCENRTMVTTFGESR
jgi:hypothetical protein